jgi:hypothetical protein
MSKVRKLTRGLKTLLQEVNVENALEESILS